MLLRFTPTKVIKIFACVLPLAAYALANITNCELTLINNLAFAVG